VRKGTASVHSVGHLAAERRDIAWKIAWKNDARSVELLKQGEGQPMAPGGPLLLERDVYYRFTHLVHNETSVIPQPSCE
jgi:hypothetical protein